MLAEECNDLGLVRGEFAFEYVYGINTAAYHDAIDSGNRNREARFARAAQHLDRGHSSSSPIPASMASIAGCPVSSETAASATSATASVFSGSSSRCSEV